MCMVSYIFHQGLCLGSKSLCLFVSLSVTHYFPVVFDGEVHVKCFVYKPFSQW